MADDGPGPDAGDPQDEGGSSVAPWVLGAAVVIAGVVLATLGEEVPERVARGASAPGFTLPRLGGQGELSLADYRDRVVLVNFWATWCKPCEEEMPSMQRLYDAFRGQPFEMIAVSVDEDAAEVEAFRERMALSFPIVLDPKQDVSRRYQTTGFPESLLIDGAGRVVERYVGPRAWDDAAYVERIQGLLGSG